MSLIGLLAIFTVGVTVGVFVAALLRAADSN